MLFNGNVKSTLSFYVIQSIISQMHSAVLLIPPWRRKEHNDPFNAYLVGSAMRETRHYSKPSISSFNHKATSSQYPLAKKVSLCSPSNSLHLILP